MVNFSFDRREVLVLAVLLLAAFLVRLLLFPLQGYANDMNTYASWFNTAATHGIRPFYSVVSWCDYPPFNVYIFWVFGSIAKAVAEFGVSAFNVVKMVPNLFDLAIAGLIYVFIRKQSTFKLALAGATLYVINPAVIYNSAVWGQFDAIYTFFILLSLMLALKAKPLPSAAMFAVGLLTKPQAIALLPLVAFLIFKKSGLRSLLLSVLVFTGTIFLVILPFEWSNPVTFLGDIYFGAYGGYAYTSINAFNTWALGGLWVPDSNLFVLGWALFGAFTVFALFVLHKRFHVSGEWLVFFLAFMMIFAFFMLPTRIHERYLFPAIALLSLMFPFIKKTRALYVVITATFLVNVSYVLYWLNAYANAGYTYSPNLSGDPVVLAVSVVNLVMFLYASMLMWFELKGKSWLKVEPLTLGAQTKEVEQAETEPGTKS